MTGLAPLDSGTFALSPECDNDAASTARLLRECGVRATQSLLSEAKDSPRPADTQLLRRIHQAWFGAAFPMYAGEWRNVDVKSRRPRVSAGHAVTNDIAAAFLGFEEDWVAVGGDYTVRTAASKRDVFCLVTLANRITVRVHHVHPFIDGNTRTCMLLRRYLLQRAGLPPVPGDLAEAKARSAWDSANPVDHEALDHLLLEELAAAMEAD